MARPVPIPDGRLLNDRTFLTEVANHPQALVHFACNIGDGDAQVMLLPLGERQHRKVVIVDAGRTDKIPPLLDELANAGIVQPLQPGSPEEDGEPIALVVATHPHDDHIRGIAEILDRYRGFIAEFWDPGYFHSIPKYHDMMNMVATLSDLLYAHPTSGFRRWIGDVEIVVLSPSVHLRNRFDSYGTEINDSSISLRVQFPTHRYLLQEGETPQEAHEEGEAIAPVKSRSLVLGADAQTLSWAYVITDFPFLRASDTPAAKVIAAATGDVDMLEADVLKVSHHASKHGVNLELVERVNPAVSIVSSVPSGGQYNFPHDVAQDIIREGIDPSTGPPAHAHKKDWDLGIFYTGDSTEGQTRLGSIGSVIDLDGITVWRFKDDVDEHIDLTAAVRWDKTFR